MLAICWFVLYTLFGDFCNFVCVGCLVLNGCFCDVGGLLWIE